MQSLESVSCVRVVAAVACAAIALAAAPAPAATCTLKRDIKVVVGLDIVVASAGTALSVQAPVGEWSPTSLDGRRARVSRRYLAVACAEGPLFSASPAKAAASSTAKTQPATPSTTTTTTTTTQPAAPPLPEPTPCRPAAERQLRVVREAARRGEAPPTIEALAAMARVVDGRCIEAHAWLAWSRRAVGDDAGALALWDELWQAWDDAPPWTHGLRSRASHVAVTGRLATLRALRTPLPVVVEEPPPGAGAASGTSSGASSGASRGGPAPAPLQIAVTGDLHFGRNWPAARAVLPPDEGAGFLDDVAPTLSAATLTLGNLETALADVGETHKCSARARAAGICFSFRAPTYMAARIGAAGFDVVSLANNHAADFGYAGLRTTADVLRAAGVETTGIGGRTASLVVQGTRVAFASFSGSALDTGLSDIATMQGMVARLDATHDVVVVMFHGGAEGAGRTHVPRAVERYLGEDRGDVWAFAHAAVDAGADLVVGSGPHVLRGVETYRGRLIAYSLGNFSSWHTFPTTGIFARSGILSVELARNGVALSARFTATTMERSGRPIVDADGGGLELVRRVSHEDFGDAFFDDDGRWARGQPPLLFVPRRAAMTAASPQTTSTTLTSTRAIATGAPDGRHDAPPSLARRPAPWPTAAAGGRSCTLQGETPVFRGGRFVPAPAGTVLTLGHRGARFTEVDSAQGRARIANALLGRCRS